MIIDEEKVKVISKNSTERIRRDSIDVKVYDDMILFYLSGFTAHIIPTRYLQEDEKEYLSTINHTRS